MVWSMPRWALSFLFGAFFPETRKAALAQKPHTEPTTERTKIATRNRSDVPSQRSNPREVPQKERNFRSEFAQDEIAIASDGNSQL